MVFPGLLGFLAHLQQVGTNKAEFDRKCGDIFPDFEFLKDPHQCL